MQLHVVAVATSGGVFHTIRGVPTFDWTPWAAVPTPPVPPVRIDCAGVGNELHLCAATSAGTLLHTFRNATGNWQPFWGDVGNAAGLPSTNFEYEYIGIAGVGNTLHVCTTINQRPKGGGITPAYVWPIYHATRSTGPSASWTSFNEVNPGQFPGSATVFMELSCGNVNGSVHMCALGRYDNQLWHTIQFSPGPPESWQSYNDVKLVQANNPGRIGTLSVAGIGPSLHVCTVVGGTLFHTIRINNTTWQPRFGNVLTAVSGVPPGSVNFVDCASVDGNLHVCCLTTTGTIFHTIRMTTPPSWQNPEGSGQAVFGNVTAVVGAKGAGNPGPFRLVTAAGL